MKNVVRNGLCLERLITVILVVFATSGGAAMAQEVRWVPGGETDVSIGYAKRYNARAWVKMGLEESTLRKAVEGAAWDFFKRKGADAVIVFFYRDGIDTDTKSLGFYTVARVTVAPNGKWEDAGERGRPKAVVDIQRSYFKKVTEPLKDGTKGFLVNDRRKGTVGVCKTADLEQETATRMAYGTPVVILESSRFAVGDTDLLSYRVKTKDGQSGWVTEWSFSTKLDDIEKTELKPADPKSAVVCNEFELHSTLSGDTLSITLMTDLPGKTEFILSVSRCYTQTGKSSRYPIDYLSKRITVAELRKGISVSVADAVFTNTLNERKELFRKIGEPIHVSSIDKEISLSATVGGDTYGKMNGNLIGHAVQELRGGRRIVESEKTIREPMK